MPSISEQCTAELIAWREHSALQTQKRKKWGDEERRRQQEEANHHLTGTATTVSGVHPNGGASGNSKESHSMPVGPNLADPAAVAKAVQREYARRVYLTETVFGQLPWWKRVVLDPWFRQAIRRAITKELRMFGEAASAHEWAPRMCVVRHGLWDPDDPLNRAFAVPRTAMAAAPPPTRGADAAAKSASSMPFLFRRGKDSAPHRAHFRKNASLVAAQHRAPAQQTAASQPDVTSLSYRWFSSFPPTGWVHLPSETFARPTAPCGRLGIHVLAAAATTISHVAAVSLEGGASASTNRRGGAGGHRRGDDTLVISAPTDPSELSALLMALRHEHLTAATANVADHARDVFVLQPGELLPPNCPATYQGTLRMSLRLLHYQFLCQALHRVTEREPQFFPPSLTVGFPDQGGHLRYEATTLPTFKRPDVTDHRLEFLYSSQQCRQAIRQVFVPLQKDLNGRVTRSSFVQFILNLYDLFMPTYSTEHNVELAEDEWVCRGTPYQPDFNQFAWIVFDIPLTFIRHHHITEEDYSEFWQFVYESIFVKKMISDQDYALWVQRRELLAALNEAKATGRVSGANALPGGPPDVVSPARGLQPSTAGTRAAASSSGSSFYVVYRQLEQLAWKKRRAEKRNRLLRAREARREGRGGTDVGSSGTDDDDVLERAMLGSGGTDPTGPDVDAIPRTESFSRPQGTHGDGRNHEDTDFNPYLDEVVMLTSAESQSAAASPPHRTDDNRLEAPGCDGSQRYQSPLRMDANFSPASFKRRKKEIEARIMLNISPTSFLQRATSNASFRQTAAPPPREEDELDLFIQFCASLPDDVVAEATGVDDLRERFHRHQLERNRRALKWAEKLSGQQQQQPPMDVTSATQLGAHLATEEFPTVAHDDVPLEALVRDEAAPGDPKAPGAAPAAVKAACLSVGQTMRIRQREREKVTTLPLPGCAYSMFAGPSSAAQVRGMLPQTPGLPPTRPETQQDSWASSRRLKGGHHSGAANSGSRPSTVGRRTAALMNPFDRRFPLDALLLPPTHGDDDLQTLSHHHQQQRATMTPTDASPPLAPTTPANPTAAAKSADDKDDDDDTHRDGVMVAPQPASGEHDEHSAEVEMTRPSDGVQLAARIDGSVLLAAPSSEPRGADVVIISDEPHAGEEIAPKEPPPQVQPDSRDDTKPLPSHGGGGAGGGAPVPPTARHRPAPPASKPVSGYPMPDVLRNYLDAVEKKRFKAPPVKKRSVPQTARPAVHNKEFGSPSERVPAKPAMQLAYVLSRLSPARLTKKRRPVEPATLLTGRAMLPLAGGLTALPSGDHGPGPAQSTPAWLSRVKATEAAATLRAPATPPALQVAATAIWSSPVDETSAPPLLSAVPHRSGLPR